MTSDVSAEDQRKIVAEFQRLREEQKEIAEEITRVEEEKREHKRVIEVLSEDCEEDQKCYQLISDSMVELTVGKVLPQLKDKFEKLSSVAEMLNKRLVDKGKELNDHRVKHNIRILSQKESEEVRQKMVEAQMAQLKK
ncbi:unnamed protein product, partial [Mesorhabditis belari]|uniref:Prefoldin subunit 2 n=1 Tax=Mesorhabditis belari TaxID=2138241 RepID=A0AAF3F495_9BILA